MNIAIIVYSKTGNTLSVAGQLEERLSLDHTVTILPVTAANDEANAKGPLTLVEIPDPTPYDYVFFAGHIQAFSLAPAMKRYLEQLPDLANKRVSLFLTQYFPYSWMGGNRGMRQMTRLVVAKSANVEETGIVHWSRKKKVDEIKELIDRLTQIQ